MTIPVTSKASVYIYIYYGISTILRYIGEEGNKGKKQKITESIYTYMNTNTHAYTQNTPL